MLGLRLPTDPRWVNLADMSLEEILTDHAYCEQKATSTCISLIQLYPDKQKLVDKLSPVVTEEWTHFRMVLEELRKRGLKLGQQRQDEYVLRLSSFLRKSGEMAGRMADKLLMSALIEARSCERFRLLSEGISDKGLREFYRKLMVSEASHYRMFLDLAEEYWDKDKVKARWQEWLDYEAGVLREMSLRGDRIH
jgi:tRNA 2-(methylsulfanyl)-N6-isopentenyladenosine37 hydroxylase